MCIQWGVIFFLLFVIYFDLKYRLIPNWLIVGAIIISWGMAYYKGFLLSSILNSLIGFSLFIIPYVVGWVGGGDVKFLMALGSMLSLSFFIQIFLTGIGLAGFVSFIILVNKRGVKEIGHVLLIPFCQKSQRNYLPTEIYLPLGACIGIAGLISILLQIGG